MTETTEPPTTEAQTTKTRGPPARRRRRAQAEVIDSIAAAARKQFSERGYAAVTTRDIAREADVSETLLFRHFGSKSALFDHVLFTPFNRLADRFLDAAREDGKAGAASTAAEVLTAFLDFLEENRRFVLTLAAKGLAESNDERTAQRVADMRRHYAEAAERIRREYTQSGTEPELPPDLAVRLGFGMVLAATLFGEWLFPDGQPDRLVLVNGIDRMLEKALTPAPYQRN